MKLPSSPRDGSGQHHSTRLGYQYHQPQHGDVFLPEKQKDGREYPTLDEKHEPDEGARQKRRDMGLDGFGTEILAVTRERHCSPSDLI